MKKFVVLIIIIAAILGAKYLWESNELKKVQTDKENVIILADALVKAFDSDIAQTTWDAPGRTIIAFELEVVYDAEGKSNDGPYYKAVRNILGDDFPMRLQTNNKKILIMLEPWSKDVEIYVESENDENMLYPDSKYDFNQIM